LSFSTPALAAPFSGGGSVWIGDSTNGTEWYIDAKGDIGHSYVYVNGQSYENVYCGTDGGLDVNGQSLNRNSDFELVTDTNGDKVISGTGFFGNLTVEAEYRMYAEGDFLRVLYVITNPTASPITFTPSVYEDPSDNYSDAGTTTDGDNQAETSDNYYTAFDATSPSVVFTRVWGSPGNFGVVDVNGLDITVGNSDEIEFSDVTINAGAKFQWIIYTRLGAYDLTGDESAKTSSALASNVAGVGQFDASWVPNQRLAVGLDASIPSNFDLTPAPTPSPSASPTTVPAASLAKTGAEVDWLLLGSLIAVVAGAGFLALGRRKRTA
jgi:LPXTG-motif cell wall-anchored protein